MRLCFFTSTPLNFQLGSGTYSGIKTLVRALRAAGDEVELINGASSVTTSARIRFNHRIAQLDYADFDATVGFDLDGYLLPQHTTPHIACVKGVLADEARFENRAALQDLTRQAELERLNLERVRSFDAPLVVKQFRELINRVRLRQRGVFSSAGESTSIDQGIAG